MRLNRRSAYRERVRASVTASPFIDNLFTALLALNGMGERALLQEALLHVSRLFRYIDGERDRVPLREECDFLAHYLELERLRFAERFTFRLLCDEKCGAASVPRFRLSFEVLPLVALLLEKTAEPLTISIECGKETVVIRVVRGGKSRLAARFSIRAQSKGRPFRRTALFID